MRLITLLLFLTFLTHQALIGYNSIPETKLPTLQKTDPAFALTFQVINNTFFENCQIPLRNTLSVAYQIVQGIKYNVVFDTKYGPVNVIAITQYWERTVDVSYMNFIDPKSSANSTNATKNTTSYISINSNASSTNKTNSLNQIKFPELKRKCDMMKEQINKLQGDTFSNESTLDVAIKTQQLNGIDNKTVPKTVAAAISIGMNITTGVSSTNNSTQTTEPLKASSPSNSLSTLLAPLTVSPKPTTTQVDLHPNSQSSQQLFSTSAASLSSTLSKSPIFSWP